ncbi:MAG: nucleotidyltransferase domain-containing protein [Leptospira sp.]|nr:nucleotidyltransferase domain-containing protein [Leptospira sp.]
MKYGLREDTISKMHSVFNKHLSIETVLIYGSRAKGDYKNGSDIDLTIIGTGLDREIRSRVAQDIDNLNTPYSVDLSLFDQIKNEDLKKHILRVGKPFYQREKINSSAISP